MGDKQTTASQTLEARRQGSSKARDFWEAAWADTREREIRTTYAPLLIGREELENKDVLDIGCGDISLNEDNAEAAKHYIGMDLAVAPLRKAREGKEGLSFVESDASLLPFKDGSFDAVISIQTLPLLGRGLTDAFAEANRVIRVGGSLTFDIAHTDIVAYNHIAYKYAGIGKKYGYGTVFPPEAGFVEVITYDEGGIRRELDAGGFEVKELQVFTNYEFDMLGTVIYQRRPKENPEDDVRSEIFVSAVKRR